MKDDCLCVPRVSRSTMQLTRAADYAVRVMVSLARAPRHSRVSLAQLASETEAPESFLSKVLQSLARGGLIESQRGHAGGFALSATGREAHMRAVVEAIDGPITLNVCVDPAGGCPRSAKCPAHPVWARAQRAMLRELEAAGIAEMAGGRGWWRGDEAMGVIE